MTDVSLRTEESQQHCVWTFGVQKKQADEWVVDYETSLEDAAFMVDMGWKDQFCAWAVNGLEGEFQTIYKKALDHSIQEVSYKTGIPDADLKQIFLPSRAGQCTRFPPADSPPSGGELF